MANEPKKSNIITLDDETIMDPATGIRYTKVNTWAGKYDLIKSAASITDIVPNRKFLLAGNKVIPFSNSDPLEVFSKNVANILYLNRGHNFSYSLKMQASSLSKSVTILDSCLNFNRFLLSPDNQWTLAK